MQPSIWWIRRDLRLSDNPALDAALNQGGCVVPAFILDPTLLESRWTGEKRNAFLFAGLRSLEDQLLRRGARLVVRTGDPLIALGKLMADSGAEEIFAERDHSPYARQRDARVAAKLPLHLVEGVTVHPVDSVLKADGTPYTVFTPYGRAWRSKQFIGNLLSEPKRFPPQPSLESDAIPETEQRQELPGFPASEAEAHRRLETFLAERLGDYADGRNRMDLEGTSALSPYLRFGMISARQVVWAARQAELSAGDGPARKSAETWLNEMIWREFYAAILYHFPLVRRQAFRPGMRSIRWQNDPADLDAWKAGMTGTPVVDAGMRQLAETGWMHNRARMISASFLVKDLLVDWRKGEEHFMQRLLDGDPAANNGGWQWTAGTGTDAAPYFRIFNPVLQGKKFDPQGNYVRRFVPELVNVPSEYIHEPWKLSAVQQRASGCVIGKEYPEPIVEHSFARERALRAYKND